MFNPKGLIAAQELHLFYVALGLMLIVVIPVFLMVFWFALRYRSSNKKANYKPNWAHSTVLEIIWWTVPFIIIAILGVITWVSSHSLSPYKPLAAKSKTLNVQVVSLDWKWLFIYPKYHIATVNTLYLPVNMPVNFAITSNAPMNSFFIPKLAGQIYAMTGMTTQLNLSADHVGKYYSFSANYSGAGFAGMHFETQVVSKNQFKAWVNKSQQSSQVLNWSVYKHLVKPTENNQAVIFGQVKPGLFKYILASFNKPKHCAGKGVPQAL